MIFSAVCRMFYEVSVVFWGIFSLLGEIICQSVKISMKLFGLYGLQHKSISKKIYFFGMVCRVF